jgi:predicted enzyme related to lactoylglutathione lyase
MAHPVTWFQISGKDGGRLQTFYKDVFAWRIRPSPDGTVGMVDADKPGGIGGGVGVSRDGNPSVALYVNVDNLIDHLQRVEAAGGQRAMEPMDLPGNMGAIAGFLDPEGNWIGIWQPPKKAPAPKRAAPRKPKKKTKPAAKAKGRAAKRR